MQRELAETSKINRRHHVMRRRLVTVALILTALATATLLLTATGHGHGGTCPASVREAGLTCVSG